MVEHLGEVEAIKASHCPSEDNVEANKQRRKIQNRKNQRAHRLRTRNQDPEFAQGTRQFQVRRWRLDEPDENSDRRSQATSSASECVATVPISHQLSCRHIKTSTSKPRQEPDASIWWWDSHGKVSLTPPSLVFPLSTDHLLHLIQYNIFRAFGSNKRTLNVLLTGWTVYTPPVITTCPISGPYRDDTNVFPLNPNIPVALTPTLCQQAYPHPIWINLIPFPRMRDNLIRQQGRFSPYELLQDLIGELMGANQFPRRDETPLTISVTDPVPHDENTVTKGRKGLIVWGEPHESKSWEATPGFFAKWAWAAEGCDDLLESSNRWRAIRGEDPIRPSASLVEM